MAQGDSKIYRDAVLKLNEGAYNEGDVWTLAFLSDTYASLDVDAANPQLSNVTVTSGGNFLSAYNIAGFSISRTGGTISFTGTNIGQIAGDAGNPSDIRSAVLYNNTSANDDLMFAWDLTTDGTTPVDVSTLPLTFSFGAAGIATATVA